MSHRPRKRFGQNFLQDDHIISNILQVINLKEDDKVVEIGPGLGALTRPLLQQLKSLIAIEIDRELQVFLKELPLAFKLSLVTADALSIDYSQWGEGLRVVGNLPYNISTPLLFHLLKYASAIEDMHFMLQKEVALRLTAEPGSKAYGRLTIMVQYCCEVQYLFDVPPWAFHPRPKVDSAMVRFIPYITSPYDAVNLVEFKDLLNQAFSMRRKTLANNLKTRIGSEMLCELGIDPLVRPEQVSINDYVRLTRYLTND